MDTPLDEHYDAIVVGARCAGAATAMLLARRGLKVLLFDRDRRGADTLSTLAIMRAGVLQLNRWGLIDQVRSEGAQPIRSTSFIYGDEVITVPIKLRDGVDALYAPRRTTLDVILADAAAKAGADVRYGPRLVDLIRGVGGRVTGAVAADLVIGADGIHSGVARIVGSTPYKEGRFAAGVVYGFFRGIANQGNRWYYRPGISIGAIPTNHDETCVFVAIPPARFHQEIRMDMEAGHGRGLAECNSGLAEEVAAAVPSERVRGFPGHPAYMRQSHGPGWALVGDAGYFKDPITAHGISDALRDAEFLARAVEQGTEAALANYQSNRDELSHVLFECTDEIAGFEWDLDSIKPLHKTLSVAMNHEVEALVSLDSTTPDAAEVKGEST
jgi:2-polyprenyl-6-methoxyphenol hydroxylase-like FAD-dependent oxidoreductase